VAGTPVMPEFPLFDDAVGSDAPIWYDHAFMVVRAISF
jgi:hypothetical protein